MIQAHIDASDFSRLGRNLHNLPADLKRNAFHAAAKRTLGKAKTQIGRKLVEYTGLPYRIIAATLSARVAQGGASLEIRVVSNWISLAKLGAKQNSRGVSVPGMKSRRHAFYATMSNGHVGVFMRVYGGIDQRKRLPIRELFGANPAHALMVDRHGEFQKMADDIMERDFLDRLLHEVSFRLSKLS